MVRFFGKPRKATAAERAAHEAAAAATNNGAQSEAKKPASASRITDKRKAATGASAPAKATTPAPSKRRTSSTTTRTTRPPRRDWAAEAAATPMDAPAPAPTSLASSPMEDDATGTPAKRRRGTRGGRGRKKAGDAVSPEAEAIRAPAKTMTVEQSVAQQANTLESFTREMTAALRSLQDTVSELQRGIGAGSGAQTAHPRVALFVDVPNLIYAAERRNVNIDFGRVLDYFTQGRELVRATAYAPITDDPKAALESQRFVHHFVGHPYRLITKPLKRFADGSMKANFDIELAIDILTMSDRLDIVVLMSGDGDFRRVVELVASRGVRVEVVAFSETASSELKSVADLYIDIGANLDKFRLK